jgi:hypothetical protein
MIEFFTTINTFIANFIGSFNPDDAVFIVYTILVFILVICSITIKGNTDNPNIYFISLMLIPGLLFIGGVLTKDNDITPYQIEAHTNNQTTRFEKTENYTASLSDFSTNNTILTLNGYTEKPEIKAKDLPVYSSATEATVYFKVNGSNAGKETYTLPIIVENFTSEDARIYKTKLTPEVTKVEENNLTITVTSNNLKKEKTVKSAVIYVTYSVMDKDKEMIQKEKERTNQHESNQSSNARDELRRIVNDDNYWK